MARFFIDRPIFAWVVAHYTDGWLTCDDGSGEIADFVHLDPAGAVSLIHVKGASSRSAGRLVAVSPHEIVTSQAAKNMVYRDKRLLLRHLSASRVDRPASWSAGQRVADRTDLLDMLQCTDASDPLPVIVVQPHVSKQVRERALATAAAGGSDDLFRLHRLEALLNVCNGAVSALGAEFAVISSLV